jgi:segregation and condensation protein B
MEFDASATVETVIELDESGQVIIQAENEVIAEETMEALEEVTPESEENQTNKNNH